MNTPSNPTPPPHSSLTGASAGQPKSARGSSTPSTHELLELASLDALGLLDADEREGFERAFRAAPASVQAQIRREQLRFSVSEDSLPLVEPPLGLKAKVLARVRDAMSAVGPRRNAEPAVLALRPVAGVNHWWRAGAIGALAAAIVMGFTALQIRNEYRGINEQVASNAVADHMLREYGARFDEAFFNAQTRFVTFSPSSRGSESEVAHGKATLLIDPVTRQGQLFCKDLPAYEGQYEVIVLDKDGNRSTALLTFSAPMAGVKRQLIRDINLESSAQLVIRQQGTGRTVLTSAGI